MEQLNSTPTPVANAPTRRRNLLLLGTAILALAVAGTAALTLTGGKSHSEHITQQGYADGPWPFTVPAVDIKCQDGSKELLAIDGTDYALNDDARNAGFPTAFGDYWIDDPSAPGAKMPIFKLIMQAKDLC